MELTPEQIEDNWKKYRTLCDRTGERAPIISKMLDSLEEHLPFTPASSRLDFHNAFHGGLVEHSLRVLSNANSLVKTFNYNVSRESLIIACLFHDLGKVGHVDLDGTVTPYYLPQDSQWHRDKLGEMYKHNPDIPYMSVPHRGVFICQHFGLQLSRDEFLAILLNDGYVLDENKPYCLKEPLLAHIVMTADYTATMHEKLQGKIAKQQLASK
jgi:hypothetical protein